jgi:hypothetical protein
MSKNLDGLRDIVMGEDNDSEAEYWQDQDDPIVGDEHDCWK